MPKLKCSALMCMYNQTRYCVRNRIHVQGSLAMYEDETQCGTFKLAKDKDLSIFNVEFGYLNDANEHLSINCDCINCKYNENDLCHKENVKISGLNADSRENTVCESFEKRK